MPRSISAIFANLTPLQMVAQVVFYGLVALGIGFFSMSPAYQVASDNSAGLKLVVRHSGILLGECEVRSKEDLQKLQPNMRIAMSCPREKAPMTASLSVDDKTLYEGTIKPSGIRSDGVVALYRYFTLPAGMARIQFNIQVANHDAKRFQQVVDVAPGSVVLVEYSDTGFNLVESGDKAHQISAKANL